MKKEELSSLIKSARNIMRKDRNLDTDVKRIPTLAWLFFLKCFDDLEKRRETEGVFKKKSFRPAIEESYRWRDWAADEAGITGDELLNFINSKLFPYLKGLTGTTEYDQRDVISALFGEITNEARSGYLLRDVINLVNRINFNSLDDIHTLSHIYESMLRELRDAAGQNGEFYTPRPVVRFIVEVVAPKLGEKVLDPAAGTGGFLVEAYEYLKKQQKKAEHRNLLQYHTLYGIEKKPMPYLLGTMNLLLHGIERPNYQETNSLAINLNDITDSRRYDVIITNPPFGGEEEVGIKSGFPQDKQTSETALLFLQLVMKSLRRPDPAKGIKGGRCGMVVPNGTLFGSGVCACIKQELIENFNLHTIIRLPKGVFAPYACDTSTNLIFFNYPGPTKEIWYYELPLPEGRKNYTKTKPLQDIEFEPIKEWWNNREVNDHAWLVPVKEIIETVYNLDIKNPGMLKALKYADPRKIISLMFQKQTKISGILKETEREISQEKKQLSKIDKTPLGNYIRKVHEKCTESERQSLPVLGVTNIQGVTITGKDTSEDLSKYIRLKPGYFAYNPYRINVGSIGLAREGQNGIVSPAYVVFTSKHGLDQEYLFLFLKSREGHQQIIYYGNRGTVRQSLRYDDLCNIEIPLPTLEGQHRIVARVKKIKKLYQYEEEIQKEITTLTQSILSKAFSGEL